jgi:hypothetical protein
MHSRGMAHVNVVIFTLILSAALFSPYCPFNPSFNFLYANESEAHLHINFMPMLAISAEVVEEVRFESLDVIDVRSRDRDMFRASWREESILNHLLVRLDSHLVYSQSTASDL